MLILQLLSLLIFIAIVDSNALPAQKEPSSNLVQTESDLLDAIYNNCTQKDLLSCLKYDIFNYIDKTLNQDIITVSDGVQIIKTSGNKDGVPRSISGDGSLAWLIFNRFVDFLKYRTVKVDIEGDEIISVVTSTLFSYDDEDDSYTEEQEIYVEEGRGKKKKRNRKMNPMLMVVVVKLIILAKLALILIVLIAGKALVVGSIAILISTFVGLKKMLGQGKHEQTGDPVYITSSGGKGDWRRSADVQSMAYKEQVPLDQKI